MKKKKETKYFLISCISVASFIFLWLLVTDGLHLLSTQLLPSPVSVVKGFIKKFTTPVPDGGLLYNHIFSSIVVALSGYTAGVCLGAPLGIAMAWYPKADKFFHPIFNLFRPMPPIAWIPIFILWFGIGLAPKAAVVFLASYIPMLLNSYEGIKRTKDVHVWVARTFGAKNKRVLFTIAIPSALPAIFTGLRVALGNSWTALVAAELMGATTGLGYMIEANRNFGNIDIVVVGMFTIGALGAALAFGLGKLERKYIKGRNMVR